MNPYQSAGGLVVAVIAVVWLVVFVPAWFRSGQDRDRQRELRLQVSAERRERRRVERERRSRSRAGVLKRLYRSRRLALVSLAAGLALALGLGLELIAAQWVQIIWVATALLGSAGLLLFTAASRRIPQLLLASMRERNLRSTVATVAAGNLPELGRETGSRALPNLGPPVADPRLWNPAPLPRPSEPALGELEPAALAGVVALRPDEGELGLRVQFESVQFESVQPGTPDEPAAPVFDVLDALRRRRAAS